MRALVPIGMVKGASIVDFAIIRILLYLCLSVALKKCVYVRMCCGAAKSRFPNFVQVALVYCYCLSLSLSLSSAGSASR